MVLICIEYVDIVECPFKLFAQFCIGFSVFFLLLLKYSLILYGYESFIRCICTCMCSKYLSGKCFLNILNLLECICLSVCWLLSYNKSLLTVVSVETPVLNIMLVISLWLNNTNFHCMLKTFFIWNPSPSSAVESLWVGGREDTSSPCDQEADRPSAWLKASSPGCTIAKSRKNSANCSAIPQALRRSGPQPVSAAFFSEISVFSQARLSLKT